MFYWPDLIHLRNPVSMQDDDDNHEGYEEDEQ